MAKRVLERKEDFADFVRRVREVEKKLSLKDVVDNARKRGYRISRGYISQIENRYGLSVTSGKLQALAAGLGISESRIFAAARGYSPSDDPDFNTNRFAELALKFDRVPEDKRVNVEALVELLDRELNRLTEE